MPEENKILPSGDLNARPSILPAVTGQQEFLARMLSGSQKKVAFAIRLNAEKMVREHGINSIGFLTLTVGDFDEDGKFQGVADAAEASRRINNLNRRVLALLFYRAIVVTERHKSGKIHFHVLGALRPWKNEAEALDIRTGFDFDAFDDARAARKAGGINQRAEIRYKIAAAGALRARWEFLRGILPKYGFGRAELTPIKKTGEAVACYISKYIEKNVCNRLPDDKRKKLVRYIGWNKEQLKPNEFEWDGVRAQAWRGKARELISLLGGEIPDVDFEMPQHVTDAVVMSGGKIRQKLFDGTQAKQILGPRWAWRVHKIIQAVSDEAVPFMVWDYGDREVIRRELFLNAHHGAVRILNLPFNHARKIGRETFSREEWVEFLAGFSEN